MNTSPDYDEALELFELLSGTPPDTHWRALLRVATASHETWALFEPYLDMEHRQVNMEALEHTLPTLSSGEARLVGLALHLYRGYGCVDIASLAEGVDSLSWFAILEALKIYRAGIRGW